MIIILVRRPGRSRHSVIILYYVMFSAILYDTLWEAGRLQHRSPPHVHSYAHLKLLCFLFNLICFGAVDGIY